MTTSDGEQKTGKIASQSQAAARRTQALAAALRANLQRRKARERALRAQDADPISAQTPGANNHQEDESKWTK